MYYQGPFVGISGFTTYEQVKRMLGVFNRNIGQNRNRRFLAGIRTNYQLVNDIRKGKKGPFPPCSHHAAILASEETLNCVQYHDDLEVDFSSSLLQIIEYGGNWLNAIHLDMVWPHHAAIRSAMFHSGRRHHLEIILTVGPAALREVGHNPRRMVEKLRPYVDANAAQHVVFEKCKPGVNIHAQGLIPYIRRVKETFPTLGVGVHSSDCISQTDRDVLARLKRHFPDISILARRDPPESEPYLRDDEVDWAMAATYLLPVLDTLR